MRTAMRASKQARWPSHHSPAKCTPPRSARTPRRRRSRSSSPRGGSVPLAAVAKKRINAARSVPGRRRLHVLAREVVLVDQLARQRLAVDARGELRSVLAYDPRRLRRRVELVQIEVPPAGNAVDVL